MGEIAARLVHLEFGIFYVVVENCARLGCERFLASRRYAIEEIDGPRLY